MKNGAVLKSGGLALSNLCENSIIRECPSRNDTSRPITRVGNAAFGYEFKSLKYQVHVSGLIPRPTFRWPPFELERDSPFLDGHY